MTNDKILTNTDSVHRIYFDQSNLISTQKVSLFKVFTLVANEVYRIEDIQEICNYF